MEFYQNNPEFVTGPPISNLALPAHDHPSRKLYVIGITGTNGKTTVSHLIGEVLRAAGYNPFVLGTLNSGNRELSTPESGDITNFMNAHLEQGGTHFVMEVTSEGIDQARILGIDFNIKILTNITQDHLDYHLTFEHYENTKMSFMNEGPAHKIFPHNFNNEPIDFTTRLLGDFNHLNIQAATTALRHIGVTQDTIQKALASCLPPKGRMETVDKGQPFLVLVDFAHTPDGLENVLRTAKDIATSRNGRLLVLFGCGGNRDRGKRSLMGKIASYKADLLVVTDDNPRQEESQNILREIVSGVDPEFRDFVIIQNRATAIDYIINQSRKNDVVILAGKGHETTQITRAGTIHFDDREEAGKAILNLEKLTTTA